VVEPSAEDVAVEKQQRTEGLLLGGCREDSLHHRMTQELPHFGGA